MGKQSSNFYAQRKVRGVEKAATAQDRLRESGPEHSESREGDAWQRDEAPPMFSRRAKPVKKGKKKTKKNTKKKCASQLRFHLQHHATREAAITSATPKAKTTDTCVLTNSILHPGVPSLIRFKGDKESQTHKEARGCFSFSIYSCTPFSVTTEVFQRKRR